MRSVLLSGRRKGWNSGFTFIEVMVVISLVGTLFVCAMGPLILTTRNLQMAEGDYGRRSGLRQAARYLIRELGRSIPSSSGPVVRLIRHDLLGGGEDDVLIFWRVSPEGKDSSTGSSVYKVLHRQFGDDSSVPGLYRWNVPGRLPAEIDPDKLDLESGQLVLPDVKGFRCSLWTGGAWVGKYGGALPEGVKVNLKREGRSLEYVDWLPKL